MRPGETAIAVLLAVRLLLPVFLPARGRLWSSYALLLALFTVAQLAIEQYRWQMLPLYLLVAVVVLIDALRLVRRRSAVRRPAADQPPKRSPARAAAGTLAGFAGLALVVAPAALFPVPALPQPTGQYGIGTLSWQLVDPSRHELYSGNPDDPRAIMVQAWYPASIVDTSALPVPWVQSAEIIGPAAAKTLGLPSFFLDHIGLSRTHSYAYAPVFPQPSEFPLLLFSHGWNGLRVQNTYQMEELASHGYVVIAVDHTYGAAATVFPDGRVAYNNPAALPVSLPDAELQPAANQLVTQWAGDLGFVLDWMAAPDASSPGSRLAGHVDLTRVGVLGHSTGGGATIEFCAHDARCKAGLTMDAYMAPVSPSVLDAGLQQPFLFMFSEAWSSKANNALFDRLYAHSAATHRAFTIAGTSHFDFTDLPMLTPLAPYIGLKGPLAGPRVLRIVDDYTVAFFDQALQGRPSTLLGGPSDAYPEVTFRP